MKNVLKLIIALILAASVCIAFVACDEDDITYSGESGTNGETFDSGDVNEGSGDNGDGSNEGGEQNNSLHAPGANTEGGWSQLYPAN